MNNKIFNLLILLVLISTNLFSQEEITVKEIDGHIKHLASDQLKGRKPGTPEGKLSAEYIANDFKKSGLKLIAKKGFQYFNIITKVEYGKNNKLKLNKINYQLKKDFVPLSFSANKKLNKEVIFVGYGFDIKTDKLKWNDYENIDVKGKIVMVLRGDPEINKRQSVFIPYSNNRAKLLTAKDKGAIAVLFVSGNQIDSKDKLLKIGKSRSNSRADIAAIHIKRNIADEILKKTKKNILELEKSINKDKKAQSFSTKTKIKFTTDVNYKEAKTQNVVAILEGSDMNLKNEYIVIGAHYDHLGMGGHGSGSRRPDTLAVHNGADDNASGVASILELAEKLSKEKTHKRSVVFIAFGAEEMGLLGSKFFVKSKLIDTKKIKAMLNFDMVGRFDSKTRNIVISGTGSGKEIEDLLKSKNTSNFSLSFSKEGYGPSDHASFYAEDIPVIYFSTGAHDDYHTPKDDLEFINIDGQKELTNFSYTILVDVINRDKNLTFQEAGPKKKSKYGRGLKVTWHNTQCNF